MYGAFKLEAVGSHTRVVLGAGVETVACPNEADFVGVQVETAALRYRLDAADPTSTTGFNIAIGGEDLIPVNHTSDIRFLGNTAVVNYQFFRLVKGA